MSDSKRASQALALAALTATCLCAFAADLPSDRPGIISAKHPIWLLEQPYTDNPLLTARTPGTSIYADHQVHATLQISCHPQTRGASLTLQIDPRALGFDYQPFEGKDASAHGPLKLTIGDRAFSDQWVAGMWAAGGALQVGSIFAIATGIPRDELAYWADDASPGQTLTLSLASAAADSPSLTAVFTLPQNNLGLRQVIQPCLDR